MNKSAIRPASRFGIITEPAWWKKNVYIMSNIWMISPIIDKSLYLTLFDLATTSWVFTIT